MTGTLTIREDIVGATGEYADTCECAECGSELNIEIDYFITNDEHSYCRDCVNCWDADRSARFMGYKSQFDLIYDYTN